MPGLATGSNPVPSGKGVLAGSRFSRCEVWDSQTIPHGRLLKATGVPFTPFPRLFQLNHRKSLCLNNLRRCSFCNCARGRRVQLLKPRRLLYFEAPLWMILRKTCCFSSRSKMLRPWGYGPPCFIQLRSMNVVSTRPSTNAEWLKISRWIGMVVLTPSTTNSASARRIHASASARVG
jgi:hypothetical protein